MMKFSEKIGTFIPDFRIFLTPGKGKFKNFANKIFFSTKKHMLKMINVCLKLPLIA